MQALYFLAFLVHAAYSCQHGVEIVTKEIKPLEAAVGNWTFVYSWDYINKYPIEFIDNGKEYLEDCLTINITLATKVDIEEKKKECAGYKYPFDWDNAKLRYDAPWVWVNTSLIISGEKENWWIMDCASVRRIVMKSVAKDYMVMISPTAGQVSELMSTKIPRTNELKCIVQNVDIGKGMPGGRSCS